MRRYLANVTFFLLLAVIFSPWTALVFDGFMWMWVDHFVVADFLGIPYTENRVCVMALAPLLLMWVAGAIANSLS